MFRAEIDHFVDWYSTCSFIRGGYKTMFQSGDAVIYFEHRVSGEVRQHFGHILSVGQSGTYKVRLEDLPEMNLFFAYLTRAM
jgi:hypothetical protein